jgi:hypothetical protein
VTIEQSRGRRITSIIALGIGGLPVLLVLLLLAFKRPITSDIWFFRVALPMGLAWLLAQGYKWVRTYMAFSMAITSCLMLVGAVLGGNAVAVVVSMLFAAPCLAASIVLLKSPSVDAYFHRQNALATLNLGGSA